MKLPIKYAIDSHAADVSDAAASDDDEHRNFFGCRHGIIAANTIPDEDS